MTRRKLDSTVFASAYYLMNPFPDDWEQLSDEALADFIQENVVEKYENLSTASIFYEITDLASELSYMYDLGYTDALKEKEHEAGALNTEGVGA
jgi:hypothetical protein